MEGKDLRAGEAGGNIRVAADPWRLGEDGAGASLVIDWQHADPHAARMTDQQLLWAFGPAARRRLAAVYLAGRLVVAHTAGYAVTDAILVEEDGGPDARAAQEASTLRHGPAPVPLEGRVRALVAGQVAARMWLEVTGRLTAPRYAATWMLARTDHNTLLELDAAEPLAFLYGADAHAPAPFAGRAISVEEAMDGAHTMLAARWHRVSALADQLTWHGRCQDTMLASILAAPAPGHPAFDVAAADRGRLVAGYPLAAIDASVEHWTRIVNRKILKQNADEAAILAKHPEYGATPVPGGALAFTAEQQAAFRASLRDALIALIGGRLQRGNGGLARSQHGERRVLELSTAPAVHPALIDALAAIGGGRYEYMLPRAQDTVIAPDAAWSRDGSAREALLWCVDDEIPACTKWIERDGSDIGRCLRPLLHPGRCTAHEEATMAAGAGAAAAR